MRALKCRDHAEEGGAGVLGSELKLLQQHMMVPPHQAGRSGIVRFCSLGCLATAVLRFHTAA